MNIWTSHKTLIVSTIYILFAIWVGAYSIFFSQLGARRHDLEIATSLLQVDIDNIKKNIEISYKNKKSEPASIRYLPVILARINEIAHNNEVTIKNFIMDDSVLPVKFHLNFVADYFTILHFTAELESLDIMIDDFKIQQNDDSSIPPQHAVSLSMIPNNMADPISGLRVEEVRKRVFAKDKRNPFQRFAYYVPRKMVYPAIDLTETYQLTAIGTQDNIPYAMIDRRIYRVGDYVDRYELVSVRQDRVFLMKRDRNGSSDYIINQRESRQGTTEVP